MREIFHAEEHPDFIYSVLEFEWRIVLCHTEQGQLLPFPFCNSLLGSGNGVLPGGPHEARLQLRRLLYDVGISHKSSEPSHRSIDNIPFPGLQCQAFCCFRWVLLEFFRHVETDDVGRLAEGAP